MNWMQHFRQRVEQDSQAADPTPQKNDVSVKTQTDPAPVPSTAPGLSSSQLHPLSAEQRIPLQRMLDELLGDGWRHLSEVELLHIAAAQYQCWQTSRCPHHGKTERRPQPAFSNGALPRPEHQMAS